MAYEEREFYALPDWTIAEHRLKLYGISTRKTGRLTAEAIADARAYAERVLPAAAAEEGGSERLGYCMIHAGVLGTWLLIHWWAHEDICCQRLAMAEPGATRFASMDHRPTLACVWEQVVMHHERNAWVRHIMTDKPDRSAYTEDRLPDGRY